MNLAFWIKFKKKKRKQNKKKKLLSLKILLQVICAISHWKIDMEGFFIELKQEQTLGLLDTPQVLNNRQTPSDDGGSLLSNRD